MAAIKAPKGTMALAVRLSEAKRAEEEATRRRVEIEVLLITHLGFKKTEGQETYEAEEKSGTCRLVLKQPISTKFDAGKWLSIKAKVPKDGHKAVVTTYELDTKAARVVQNDHPGAWAVLCQIIERKPGKVQVSLDEILTLGPASKEAG